MVTAMIYELAGHLAGKSLRIPLSGQAQFLGRGAQCDLRLEDPSVSRRHAELRAAGDRLELRDLGSSNGTWHNGSRVSDWVALRPGDELRFGRVKLTLRDAASPEQVTLPRSRRSVP
jgi:pSer/pThr/pTyr-binding forkhead associated (FHA) protein